MDLSSDFNNTEASIRDLEKRLDSKFTNAQSDEERARLKKLMDRLTDAKKVERAAPTERKYAEEEYYKYLYGDSYRNQMKMWYATEAEQVGIKQMQQKNAVLTQINEGIFYLTSQLTYLEQLDRIAGVPSGAKTVEEVKQENTATSIRKAGFFGESDQTILIWTNIMNCIIFVYGCLLLVVLRNNLTEPLTLITILATFASVFALDFVLKFLYIIPSLFIQYIGWGYSPVEFSNWWYLWIPASLIGMYIIISSIL